MKTHQRIPQAILLLSIFGATSLSHAIAKIEIDPVVRAQPQWFWQSTEAKCVAVPAHDLIFRIAPKIVRENNITSDKVICKLQTGERRIEASLQCEGKILQTFFIKEGLCITKLTSPTSK